MLKEAGLAPAGKMPGETAAALIMGAEALSPHRLIGWGQCADPTAAQLTELTTAPS